MRGSSSPPKHTVRTCHQCGIRKPQPEMKQVTIYREVGQTRPTASASTFFGAFLGSKPAAKSVERAIFNTNQRTLRRKQQVWVCGSKTCMKDVAAGGSPSLSVGEIILVVLVGGAIAAYMFGGGGGGGQPPSATAVAIEETAPASVPAAVGEMEDVAADIGYVAPAPDTVPDMGYAAPSPDAAASPRQRPQGTCYLKPGTRNVIVTDWEDKVACAVELGLTTR